MRNRPSKQKSQRWDAWAEASRPCMRTTEPPTVLHSAGPQPNPPPRAKALENHRTCICNFVYPVPAIVLASNVVQRLLEAAVRPVFVVRRWGHG